MREPLIFMRTKSRSPLSNIKISLFGMDGKCITSNLYAKVTGKSAVSRDAFRVAFTSVPPEGETFIRKILDTNTDAQ